MGTTNESKKCVLVVDDSPFTLRTVKNILDSFYDVEIATSADQAMMIISRRTPDLMLVDYEMPKCNGKEFFQKVRMMPKLVDVPVIFLTAVADASVVKDILQMRPQGYMLKPIDSDKLLMTVMEQIG